MYRPPAYVCLCVLLCKWFTTMSNLQFHKFRTRAVKIAWKIRYGVWNEENWFGAKVEKNERVCVYGTMPPTTHKWWQRCDDDDDKNTLFCVCINMNTIKCHTNFKRTNFMIPWRLLGVIFKLKMHIEQLIKTLTSNVRLFQLMAWNGFITSNCVGFINSSI